MESMHLFELPVLGRIIPILNGILLLLNGIIDLLCEQSEQVILDEFKVETLVALEGVEPFAPGLTLIQHQCRAHDADLAELVGRTNVHIFLVPR